MKRDTFPIPFIFLVLALLALYFSVFRPMYNWDMIPYVASAKHFEEKNFYVLHAYTYEQVRQSVPPAVYVDLVDGSYREAISTNVRAFREQLPFYQIRPVYNGLIYLFSKAGMNVVFATHFISCLAILAAILLLSRMSTTFLTGHLMYAVPMFTLLFGTLEMARLSTPDALAFLSVLFASYLFLTRQYVVLLFLLPIAIAIRMDLILFTVPLSAYILFLNRRSLWMVALSVFASLTMFVGIGHFFGNPGWSAVFYHKFVAATLYPMTMHPLLTVHDYVQAFLQGTREASRPFVLFIPVAVSLACLVAHHVIRTSLMNAIKSVPNALALVNLAYLMGHFMIFPSAETRFFAGGYLMSAFAMLMILERDFEPKPIPE